jgi:4-amino-4-deoxy-L-arabinose transferase-like glycosyltransferase
VDAVFNRFSRCLSTWFGSAFSRQDVAALVFVFALAVYSFWPEPTVADHVHADTVDYALPALNFLDGDGFVNLANGHKYPPTHPFGFSALLAAAYAILGTNVGNGAYLVFLFGLATVLLTYCVARTLFDRRVAVMACVLLALANQYRFYSKVIAPDGAVSAFFCLASQILLFAALRNPQSSLSIWVVLGQALGFSLTLRPDNALLLLPVAALLILRLRGQNRAFLKMAVFAGGILFWMMTLLWANFLYSGDWFRDGYAINYSAQHDRLGGMVSWRYFAIPTFRESNFVKLLGEAPLQWSLFGAEIDSIKKYFYYATDVFLLGGLIHVWRASKKDLEKRDLLIWISLWFLASVAFFSCIFLPTDARYFQRLVPYFCLLSAIGLVSGWDWASRLHGAFTSQLMLTLRILLAVGLMGAGLHILVHPHVAAFARVPQLAYLQHVNEVIREKDAMILTDWPLPWVEHFVARDSQRTIVPLQQFDSGADSYVQWKRPPHPEWITEDCPNRDNTATVRYRRMYENGAQDVYPNPVFPYPVAIDVALQSGRSVYLVTQGGPTIFDKDAIILLIYRYGLEPVESGWIPGHKASKEVVAITRGFIIAKVLTKPTFDIRLRNTPEGYVRFETDMGVSYGFPGRVESFREDNTRFKIKWHDVEHSEQTLKFTPDGLVEILP